MTGTTAARWFTAPTVTARSRSSRSAAARCTRITARWVGVRSAATTTRRGVVVGLVSKATTRRARVARGNGSGVGWLAGGSRCARTRASGAGGLRTSRGRAGAPLRWPSAAHVLARSGKGTCCLGAKPLGPPVLVLPVGTSPSSPPEIPRETTTARRPTFGHPKHAFPPDSGGCARNRGDSGESEANPPESGGNAWWGLGVLAEVLGGGQRSPGHAIADPVGAQQVVPVAIRAHLDGVDADVPEALG